MRGIVMATTNENSETAVAVAGACQEKPMMQQLDCSNVPCRR